MNIFVLCTGRCGSTTFSRASQYIHNYTAAHESRTGFLGPARFDYPENHIEVDNRLAWLLGRLDKKYGDDAFYVHLTRNEKDTCNSLVKRINQGIMRAYKTPGVLLKMDKNMEPLLIAQDYYRSMNENIKMFLKDKTQKMDFRLENAAQDFPIFCERINADVSLSGALKEFDIKHNASPTDD